MRRWISRWENHWRERRVQREYAALRKQTVALSNYHPGRKTLEDLLRTLDVARFASFRNSHAVGIEIKPFYPTIDVYQREIKIINSYLTREGALPTTWATLDARPMGLDHFFTSAEGFYLNVADSLAAFKRDALILCTLMENSDNAALGVHEHNLRMLTKLLVNVRLLVLTLVDLSFEIGK
ncbi:hypothetical protein AWB81_01820 [Caballeronia arationis]|uniref:hypothetical protein n=1 Tax=Caballeronia arationis TaxID=1777142 RepID=UPI00074D0D7B|nr:hypothetical protein [Caballeronia arationis]SAK59289.1 hypothetical protein AWB81_01820 [Caballeronia arationis]